MILSHKYKFIFIKAGRAAGTSTELALSTICGPHDIITPTTDEHIRREIGGAAPQNCLKTGSRGYEHPNDRDNLLFYNHIGAGDIRALVGAETWDAYFKFCIVRNPWDRAISACFFVTKGPRPPISAFLASPGNAGFLTDWRRYTINDRVAVDHVAKYEDLQVELDEIGERLGFPHRLRLPMAKAGHRTDRRPYREVLSDADALRIAEVCGREIKEFGYRF